MKIYIVLSLSVKHYTVWATASAFEDPDDAIKYAERQCTDTNKPSIHILDTIPKNGKTQDS